MKRTAARKTTLALATAALLGGGVAYMAVADHHEQQKWEVHDMKRPKPPVIQPGTFPTPEAAGQGAVGRARAVRRQRPVPLAIRQGRRRGRRGRSPAATWRSAAAATCRRRIASATASSTSSGPRRTEVKGASQGRGNSGIFFMGNYEVQVLDSYENETYADGQAAALYGQYPPLVNASLPPGQWQTYDIVFRRPHFGEDGKVVKPATVTVFHNGVLVQDHRELKGTTAHKLARRLHEARRQAADPAAGPREPGAVPEHLDPAARRAMTSAQPRSGEQNVAPSASPGDIAAKRSAPEGRQNETLRIACTLCLSPLRGLFIAHSDCPHGSLPWATFCCRSAAGFAASPWVRRPC